MKIKNLSLGLTILLAALVLAQGAMAYPTEEVVCTNCHTLSSSISISTTSPTTVTPGQIFDVSITWSGGASKTAVKWPSVNNNTAFGLIPAVKVSSSASGTATSTLTAPSAEGSYNVTVYVSTLSGSNKITNFKDIAITVKAATTAPPVLTMIDVSPATATVINGSNKLFTAAPKDQYGNPITATMVWTSSNATVGNVDASGKFTALAAGAATIKAANGTVNGTATVNVVVKSVPVLNKIKVTPSPAKIKIGRNQSFMAKTRDQFNHAISAIVTWASSNTTVGTIDSNGKFTALAQGTTVISATNGTISGNVTITVFNKHHDKKNNSDKKHEDKIKEKKPKDKKTDKEDD